MDPLDPDGGWDRKPPVHSPPSMREALATYYAMVENLDWNLGRLVDHLQADPRLAGEKTVLVYTADHGEFMGSHGLFQRKELPHEESVRVPLIFHAPGRIVRQGLRHDGLPGLVDLAPTLLGLVDLPVPVWMQGRDCARAVNRRRRRIARVTASGDAQQPTLEPRLP